MLSEILEQLIPSKTYCNYLKKIHKDTDEYFILYLVYTQLWNERDYEDRLKLIKQNASNPIIIDLINDPEKLKKELKLKNIPIPHPFKEFDIVKFNTGYTDWIPVMYCIVIEAYNYNHIVENIDSFDNDDYYIYCNDDPRPYDSDNDYSISPLLLEKVKMKEVPKYLRHNLRETKRNLRKILKKRKEKK